ncbi:MAG: nucleotidyltransferase domain-containing protein [Anaerolineae bacterium]|nr:nucleotidyltransferase domain-containing protein [Anaerolineae bacterium]
MDTDSLIQSIVAEIKTVSGVKAIVLGGSRARGTHTPSSDVDLGIYYDPSQPIDLDTLGKVAAKLDDEQRADVITGIGGWGPWINGGGWLRIQSLPVDFLYRDLDRIKTYIDACLNGKVEIFYQGGHPHGFVTSIYLGEVALCKPLYDPEGIIAELKGKVTPYPEALQKAIFSSFAWEIDFSVGIAKKSIERADVNYAAGSCFRAVMCMLQVLFALNKEYWMNEKGALAITDRFAIKPADFRNRVNEIYRLLDASPEAIERAVTLLKGLCEEVYALLPK